MKIKDLRRVIEILAPLDDDTSVNIDFGGFTMDNDFIESVEICNDGESEYVNIGIGGKVYNDGEEYVDIIKGTTRSVEKATIVNALKECHQNREEAARMLGLSPRTIYRKIKQYGIKED